MRHAEDHHQGCIIRDANLMTYHVKEFGRVKMCDVLAAVPNGGYRKRVEAARLKGLGVRAGYSDLLIDCPAHGWPGARIEMKKRVDEFASPSAAERAVSQDQHKFLIQRSSFGYACAVCYGQGAFWAFADAYFKGDVRTLRGCYLRLRTNNYEDFTVHN